MFATLPGGGGGSVPLSACDVCTDGRSYSGFLVLGAVGLAALEGVGAVFLGEAGGLPAGFVVGDGFGVGFDGGGDGAGVVFLAKSA